MIRFLKFSWKTSVWLLFCGSSGSYPASSINLVGGYQIVAHAYFLWFDSRKGAKKQSSKEH